MLLQHIIILYRTPVYLTKCIYNIIGNHHKLYIHDHIFTGKTSTYYLF